MTTLTDHWHDLVTAALLGTDRREPPDPLPGALADVVDDALAPTPAARILATVAATVAVRRAGLRPRPPVATLTPPERDERPVLPPAAARRWRPIATTWPVLEDEWLATVECRGFQLSPDVLVGLLRRHRMDAARRARVMRLGGSVASWLVEQQPELTGTSARNEPSTGDGLPGLPVPPSLLPLLTEGADAVVPAVVGGIVDGSLGRAHRAVLVNFVARMRPDVCGPLADALHQAEPETEQVWLAELLADLARSRHEMLEELS